MSMTVRVNAVIEIPATSPEDAVEKVEYLINEYIHPNHQIYCAETVCIGVVS